MTDEEILALTQKYSRRQITGALEQLAIRWWVTRVAAAALVLIVLMMGGCPHYNVWERGLAGQAELARAEQNRQIRIEEARAAMESAEMLADAEVLRAAGVKEANDIIAEGLGGAEGYLRYLFIQGLNSPDTTCQTIYVPTEANLPVLEATRSLKQ